MFLRVLLDAVLKEVSPIATKRRDAEAQKLNTAGQLSKIQVMSRGTSGSSNGEIGSVMENVTRTHTICQGWVAFK
jgi:hypothetical protein